MANLAGDTARQARSHLVIHSFTEASGRRKRLEEIVSRQQMILSVFPASRVVYMRKKHPKPPSFLLLEVLDRFSQFLTVSSSFQPELRPDVTCLCSGIYFRAWKLHISFERF